MDNIESGNLAALLIVAAASPLADLEAQRLHAVQYLSSLLSLRNGSVDIMTRLMRHRYGPAPTPGQSSLVIRVSWYWTSQQTFDFIRDFDDLNTDYLVLRFGQWRRIDLQYMSD